MRGGPATAARSLAYEEADRLYRMALAGMDLTGATDERSRTEILLALGEVQGGPAISRAPGRPSS